MIVVDASAALLALYNDGDARATLSTETLAAPHLVDAEVVHALRRRTLAGQLESSAAANLVDRWMKIGLERVGSTHLLARVWDLRSTVSAYDATYVAVAEWLRCPLLTADARLANAPGPHCPITVVRT